MKPLLQNFPEHECRQYLDDPSHAKIGIHAFPGKLYVVTMLENPLRWRARYRNYAAFEHHVEQANALLYTGELAFGERHFEITSEENPRNVQLRAQQDPWNYELWHKENVLNVVISRLPQDAKYIAWIDSDVRFARPDWAQETLHMLQQYQFLQMFSHSIDLGPNDEPLQQSVSYTHSMLVDPAGTKGMKAGYRSYGYGYGQKGYYGGKGMWLHPGFAWAARKDALNHVGGLIDWAILGSGDWLMASSLFGEVDLALNRNYSGHYRQLAKEWEKRAERYIKRNVGVMSGLVFHSWHGKKAARKYDERWRLLVETKFDPLLDLKKDWQGLWTLTDRNRKLRDGLRMYSATRSEDSVEV